MLHQEVAGHGPRVVLVHGFTQTVRSWDEVALHLGPGLEVVRVDLPGHGGSGTQRLDFPQTAAAIGQMGGPAVYAGYSMGGRLCLRLAVDFPHLTNALVLIGASPGLADETARNERRRSDARLAGDLAAGGTKSFLDVWLAQPMFETTTPRAGDLAARQANSAEGLSYALQTLGTGSQESLWHRLDEVTMPVLLIVGEHDAKFRGIAERMAPAFGGPTEIAVVAGAGHAVPLDQPEECASLIRDFVGHAPTPSVTPPPGSGPAAPDRGPGGEP